MESETTDKGSVSSTCSYTLSNGQSCPGAVDSASGPCFWHDEGASKEGSDVRERLEQWADSGGSMEGFQLPFAALQGIRLSNRKGRNLQGANLFRANLQGASMFDVDLRGARLIKANLAGANLNESILQGADLLGAALDGTRLERVEWGDRCVNEEEAIAAKAQGDIEKASGKLKEAEEVYRVVRRSYAARSDARNAGLFFSGRCPSVADRCHSGRLAVAGPNWSISCALTEKARLE